MQKGTFIDNVLVIEYSLSLLMFLPPFNFAQKGITAMHLAAQHGNVQALELLLGEKENLNLPSKVELRFQVHIHFCNYAHICLSVCC